MRLRTFLVGGAVTASFGLITAGLVACSDDNETSSPGVPDTGVPDVTIDTSDIDTGSPPDAPNDAPPDGGPLCIFDPCVVHIAAGDFHTCAALVDGTIRCWGFNADGQIGQPLPATFDTRYPKPLPVTGLDGVTEITGSGAQGQLNFMCAREKSGAVKCWGNSRYGQTGNGPIDASSPVPSPVPGVTDAVHVSAGVSHACAITTDGGVVCWGTNSSGELGFLTPDSGVVTPSLLTGFTPPVLQLDLGYRTTCALSGSGYVECMGTNSFGELGNVDADAGTSSSVPVTVSGLTGATKLMVGYHHGCALVEADGSVVCWGRNNAGQLGRGQDTSPDPKRVELPPERRAVDIGGGPLTSCAVLDDGSLWCWGSNELGAVGPTEAGLIVYSPRRIEGLPQPKILEIAGGLHHMCALVEGGSVWCWGSDLFGELGRNNPTPDAGYSDPTPRPVVF